MEEQLISHARQTGFSKLAKRLIFGIVTSGFLLSLLAGFFLYRQNQQLLAKSSKDGAAAVEQLVQKIGKIIELPEGEDPTVATVSDKEKLKGQFFFQRAENGDSVLIYARAKKAILYRSSENKIIDVSVIDGNGQSDSGNIAGASSSAQSH